MFSVRVSKLWKPYYNLCCRLLFLVGLRLRMSDTVGERVSVYYRCVCAGGSSQTLGPHWKRCREV